MKEIKAAQHPMHELEPYQATLPSEAGVSLAQGFPFAVTLQLQPASFKTLLFLQLQKV